jgi:dTDP-4-dehydrorhamnose 3,5-epimerase
MIAGLTITPLRQIADELGSVRHMLRSTDAGFAGFGEVYFSTVKCGAVKAWKRHREMTLNLVCVVGRVRLVCYDDRRASETQGQTAVIELTTDSAGYARVTVPPGIWTGFFGTAPGESILCNCGSLPHDPAESDRLPWDAPEIPYRWEKSA